MKKIISALLTLGLILSLCACGDEKKEDTNKSAKSANSETSVAETSSEKSAESESNAETEKNEPAETKEAATEPAPADNDIFPEGVIYTEEYTREGDPGDNLTPAEAALEAVNFFDDHFYFYGGVKKITYSGLVVINDEECYHYNVEDEMPQTGRCAVNYATGEIFLFLEEEGEYQSVNEMYDNSEFTDAPDWWGEYGNGEFSIYINNFNGDSFSFSVSNLRNGEEILSGVAAIDPDDKNMAIYGDCGFYIYEDMEHIDFLTSESGEWSHLRGQYTQF